MSTVAVVVQQLLLHSPYPISQLRVRNHACYVVTNKALVWYDDISRFVNVDVELYNNIH